nr:MAG TPA: protein of unknown function (DUF4805) [Caudoviricetes sp.]
MLSKRLSKPHHFVGINRMVNWSISTSLHCPNIQ